MFAVHNAQSRVLRAYVNSHQSADPNNANNVHGDSFSQVLLAKKPVLLFLSSHCEKY